jgi:hypothetical protein
MKTDILPKCCSCSRPAVDCKEFIRIAPSRPVRYEEAKLLQLVGCTAEGCRGLLAAHGCGNCPCGLCREADELDLILRRVQEFLEATLHTRGCETVTRPCRD